MSLTSFYFWTPDPSLLRVIVTWKGKREEARYYVDREDEETWGVATGVRGGGLGSILMR